jgi:hypothetical protein
MQNDATKTRSLNVGFIVDADFLRRVENVLSELKAAPEYNVQFSDGTTVTFPSVEDIIKQPNARERCIVSIIAGVEGRNAHSAYLTMRDNPPPSIEYTVKGPQRDVIYFAAKLDELVAASQHWYSWFFSRPAEVILGFGALIAPLIFWDTLYRHFFVELAKKGKPPGWLSLSALVVMYIAVVGVYKLFPRGTFAIGHGLNRHKQIAGVRNTVLGAFVIAILVEWIMRHF